MQAFSLPRFFAMALKEFMQIRRDRPTLAMMIGIPIFQLVIFGYAINSDPKNLPAAVLAQDTSVFSRRIVAAFKTSGYFDIVSEAKSEEEASELLETGRVQFLLQIPPNFSRKLLRGEQPELLLEADATDPAATGNAVAAMSAFVSSVLSRDLSGALPDLALRQDPLKLIVHRKYNPEIITAYNIVPGLMGVILTLTMVVITALVITRERERGTLEGLLSTPVKPLEVMLGKLVPYILVGYVQVFLILTVAKFLFDVPMVGSLSLLLLITFLFIVGNLAVGMTFSTLAKNQIQSVQMAIFFFLPSILLSGFMFPFHGMPQWAQDIGSMLPLTHFLRIVRGILLKGNGLHEVLIHVWPILLFTIAAVLLGLLRYRRTLD